MAETTEKAEPDTLLPCPFCGESVAEMQSYEKHDKTFYHVCCDECGAQAHGGYHMSPKGAAGEWNTRAAPARCDAPGALTKKDFNRLVELYNRRIEYDVIGIPYEEHRALGRALDILRPALSETKPL